ncbi:poly(A)-specific ribonuclease [Malassezia pachydermatis]
MHSRHGQPGEHDKILTVHVNSGRIVRHAPSEAAITHMRRSGRYVCCGTSQGTIQLRDPRTLQVEHKLTAHHGGLLDMQAEGHLLYSIGWTLRQGRRVAEPFIKAHDLRSMNALVPIPMTAPGGPAFLAVHPKKSSILAVATPQSQFQIVDTANPGLSQFYAFQSNAFVTSMAFSSSAETLAFGESDGCVRLWSTDHGTNTPPRFNSYPTAPVPMPDYAPPPPVVEWTETQPLSSIGMPHYDKPLLSNMDYDKLWSDASPLFTVPSKVDESALEQVHTVQGVSFASLPRHWRGARNRIVGSDDVLNRFDRHGKLKPGTATRIRHGGRGTRRVNVPFRSEKDEQASTQATAEAEAEATWRANAAGMPGYYAPVTIQYSRFGVEDFDFAFYNKTAYSGLETNIGASYANSYLQALHYARPFRLFATSHIKMACEEPDCLLCEAGFLFRMLEDAKGTNCQASNLLRVLARTPQAITLGLLDDEANHASYAHMAQNLSHYFLDQATYQALRTSHALALTNEDAALCANPCAWSMHVQTTCNACGHTSTREQVSHVVDLLYPNGTPQPQHDFAALLGASMRRDTMSKMTCRHCHTPYAPHTAWRALLSTDALPAVLTVNAGVMSAEQLGHWVPQPSSQGFLAPRMALRVDRGRVAAQNVWTDADAEAFASDSALYLLRAMVVQVQGGYDAPHLCAMVRGPGDNAEEWVLFNDFLVRTIDEKEALRFDEPWKIPAVLVWERVDAAATAHMATLTRATEKLEPDWSLLTQDWNLAQHRKNAMHRHHLLTPDELPKPGTLVAIDAEFVSLALEDMEVFSDGSRSLLQPSHLALARVSVLRGEGPHEGDSFIDDHIHTTEPVVDYLTQYSGIQPGDLDPAQTAYTIVPHKLAYKKLRLLVDIGCRFIGHGLTKDFRIINIYVPPSQVIDTVLLYHSPAHPRNLSLRFLSWFLLKKDIQQGLTLTSEDSDEVQVHHGHDSIEDALAALQLYRRYEQFERDNRLEDMLEDLYEIGPRVHWRPPEKT